MLLDREPLAYKQAGQRSTLNSTLRGLVDLQQYGKAFADFIKQRLKPVVKVAPKIDLPDEASDNVEAGTYATDHTASADWGPCQTKLLS
jgi:hypothetical protein